MRAGADVIYQAPFAYSGWRGVADFLERIEEPSALGGWSYEAVDTKLARTEALPHHALQLVFYATGIERIQGGRPTYVYVELGSGSRERIRLREIDSYAFYARTGMSRAVELRRPTEPIPCEHCRFCRFEPACTPGLGGRRPPHAGGRPAPRPHSAARELRRDDADAARGAAARVRGRGHPARRARGGGPAGAPAARGGPRPHAALRAAAARVEGRGFALLPEPSAGDVMFDFEGDPFWTPARGLMFLVGLLLRDGDGWTYEAFWAHDRDGERRAFERLVDLLTARLAQHPDMHVYHYSAAETSEVKRLMAEHATREAEVDDLLRRRVFVDLLTVTQQALRAGVRSYSLKQTELLAGLRARGARWARATTPCSTTSAGARARPGASSTPSRPTTRRTAWRRSRCATGCSRGARRGIARTGADRPRRWRRRRRSRAGRARARARRR